KYGMAIFDTSFTSLGNLGIHDWPAPIRVQSSYLVDFGVDFHVRIPFKQRWAPYVIGGAGLLWDRVGLRDPDPVAFNTARHVDQFSGALHTGGGVRHYISENFGMRSELKA